MGKVVYKDKTISSVAEYLRELKAATWDAVKTTAPNHNLKMPNAPVTEAAEFSERVNHTTAVFDDKLWLIWGSSNNGYINEIWAIE